MRINQVVREKARDQQPIGEYMKIVGFGSLKEVRYCFCLRFKNGKEEQDSEYLLRDNRTYVHTCRSIQVSQERFDAIMNTPSGVIKNHVTKQWESLITDPVDVIRFNVIGDKSQYVYVTYERARREIKQERWYDDEGKEHISSANVFIRVYGITKLNSQ